MKTDTYSMQIFNIISFNLTYMSDMANLIRLFEAINWLDKKRWEHNGPWPMDDVVLRNDLTNSQKILIHWLGYIYDRTKNADVVWKKVTEPITKLVKDYCAGNYERVEDLIDKYLLINGKGFGFAADDESVRRTLILLEDYNRNIIEFIVSKLNILNKNFPNNVGRGITYALYTLSYDEVGKLKRDDYENKREYLNKIVESKRIILNDDNKFIEGFKQKSKLWHKRVWAALRDYKKSPLLKNVFEDGIEDEEAKEIWRNKFTIDQLELPGDLHNIYFYKICFKPLIEDLSDEFKFKNSDPAPSVIREVYNKLIEKGIINKFDFYPEQFDVSVDFSPMMCEREMKFVCNEICIFGKSGGHKNICRPIESYNGTLENTCYAAYRLCGYVVKCENKNNCPIRNGKFAGLCKGIQ